jgi:hypothetical protein
MTVIADYSWARPSLHALKAAGAEGIQRYLAPLPNKKVIDSAEYHAALDAGLTVSLLWESVNQRALGGAAAGAVDGGEAARQAHLLGHTGTIYAVLEDPNAVDVSQYPAVDAYARAFAKAYGAVIGGYGSQRLVELLLQRGVIGYGQQVGGWSDTVSAACHLYQRLTPTVLAPFVGDVDEDAILKPDYGQVPRPVGTDSGGPVMAQLAAPICAGVIRPQEDGYWLIGRDGGIFNFGGAPQFEPHLVIPDSPQEIIDAKCTRSGQGLYLFGADGGVFTFGDASNSFFGSVAALASVSTLPPRG